MYFFINYTVLTALSVESPPCAQVLLFPSDSTIFDGFEPNRIAFVIIDTHTVHTL